jgi:hypothetical protein
MQKKKWAKVSSFIVTALAGIKGVLDYLGHIDFIAERYHNPGWMGTIFNHVMSFSPGFNIFIFIGAFVVFCILFFKKQKAADESILSVSTPSHHLVVEFDGNYITRFKHFSASSMMTGIPTEREYSFVLFNSGINDIKNVRLEVESVSEVPPCGNLIGNRGNKIAFEDGTLVMTFPSKHREPIQFLSFTYYEKNQEICDPKMLVKTKEPFEFEFQGRPYELLVKITGEKINPIEVPFFIEFYSGKIKVDRREASES